MGSEKKKIRANFRSAVFSRDGHKCRKCGATGELDAHHITDRSFMPSGGYVKENGISLCAECHLKAEAWHISQQMQWVEGYHPNELYRLIGSSYEDALRASSSLKEE